MAIDKTQDNPTKEGQDADAPVKYTLTKDSQLTVGAMVFDRAHWVIGGKTTRAQRATPTPTPLTL